MMTSVADITLKDCCIRTLRHITERLLRGGLARPELARPSLRKIFSTNPTEVRNVSLADWRELARVAGEVSDEARSDCHREARLEVLRHGGAVGPFWRSFADCFR